MTNNITLRENALNYGLILGIVGSIIATINSFFSFSDPLVFILALIMTLLLSLYFYLYKRGIDTTLLSFLTVTTVFAEILLKEQLTDVGLGIYFWIYVFPIAIFSFFTPVKSLLLNIVFLSIFLFFHKEGVGKINSDYFLYPLAFSYFAITILNYVYQRFQEKQSKEISEKTEQLNALNHSLQQRINDAITESKSKDKILAQQSKLAQMGELLSMISHQWRQPLGSIAAATISLKTKIELEKYDLSKEDEREAFLTYLSSKLDNIEGYTTSLSNTIDDFKNFYNPNKEMVKEDILKPVKNALELMTGSFNKHKITIKESYQDTPDIQHHPNEIMQVMLNILNNAAGNFKEKEIQNPEIKLLVEAQKDTIMIEICDNGGGIEDAIIDKIFDPYFSTKDEKNGTGLGLYMSKTIIEEHHKGKLSVSNKNGGACFTITIPKSQNNSPLYDAPPAQK